MKQTAIYRPHRPQIASIHIMIEALEGKIRSLNLHSGTDLAIEQLSQNLLEEAYYFLMARVTGVSWEAGIGHRIRCKLIKIRLSKALASCRNTDIERKLTRRFNSSISR